MAPPDKDYLSTFHSVFRGLGEEAEEKGEEEGRRIEIVNRISIPESEGMAVMLAVIKVVAATAWQVGIKYGLVYRQYLVIANICCSSGFVLTNPDEQQILMINKTLVHQDFLRSNH